MVGPFLHPFAPPLRDEFLTIVRGEGAAVFDRDGQRYVDALASLWYCNIGHGRREMAEVIARQVEELATFNTFDIFSNEPADALCERLAGLSPVPDARVFLTNSGSEAVDTALKLARLRFFLDGRPEKHLVVAREHAYHGTTYGGMSAQGLQGNREGFAPYLPEVHHVDAHRIDAVEQFFAERGDRVAAFIAEPVIGAGGVQPPAPGYLQAARRLCDEHDALLILDEVITGFGRLGSWFASQHYGVTPDLVTFAKAVTSGYLPLGGVLVGRKVREPLEADPAFVLRTGFTYSGHPTVCAAALENLRILDEEGLVARAAVVGGRLVAGLRRLGDDGLVEEVRGEGAIWAVGLLPEIDAVAVREQMLTRGVLTRAIGGSTIAFCPPLVIDDEDVDLCIDALDGALRQVIAGV